MILEEFDYDKDAILNPVHFMESQIVTKGLRGRMPKVGVSCFERKGFNRILELLDCKEIAVSKNANDDFPIYVANYKGKEIALFLMDMGAAGAKFRDKEFFQFFFAADNLDAKEWDRRSLGDEVKFEEKDMFAQLAMELAVRIS